MANIKLKDLKRYVLDNSNQRLKDNADVYFNYSTDNIGGSRAQNQIYFTFIGNNKAKPKGKKTDMYMLSYNILTLAFPSHTNSIAQDICDRVSKDPVLFEKLYKRMKGIKHDLDDYKKDLKQTIGLIKYVVKEDYS